MHRQNAINKNRACMVTLQWSVIMGEYNTPDSVVRDRSSKTVMK